MRSAERAYRLELTDQLVQRQPQGLYEFELKIMHSAAILPASTMSLPRRTAYAHCPTADY